MMESAMSRNCSFWGITYAVQTLMNDKSHIQSIWISRITNPRRDGALVKILRWGPLGWPLGWLLGGALGGLLEGQFGGST